MIFTLAFLQRMSRSEGGSVTHVPEVTDRNVKPHHVNAKKEYPELANISSLLSINVPISAPPGFCFETIDEQELNRQNAAFEVKTGAILDAYFAEKKACGTAEKKKNEPATIEK